MLEVGCGEGRLTFQLSEAAASWLATDPAAGLVAEARRRLPAELTGKVTFAVAGGAEIDAPAAEFDLVLFSWSL